MDAPAGRHRGRRQIGSGSSLPLETIVGLALAGVFVMIGVVLAHDTYVLSTRGQLASGVVLDKYSEGRTTFIDVRFTTKTGEQIQAPTDWFVDHDPVVEVGDRIRVVYDPADPETFQDARFGFDYLLPIVLWGGAVLVGGWTIVAAVRD